MMRSRSTTGDRGFKSPFFTDSFGNLDLYEIGFVKAASAAARTQTVEDMWMMVDFLPPTATAVRHRVTQ